MTRSEAEVIAGRYLEQHSFAVPPILTLESGAGWVFPCVPPEPMIGGVFAILVEQTGAIQEFGAGAIWQRIVYRMRAYERPAFLSAAAEDRSAAMIDRIVEVGRVELLDLVCAQRLLGGDVLLVGPLDRMESLKTVLLHEGFQVSTHEVPDLVVGL